MSAIFGIIDIEGRPVEETWIGSMQDDLNHRGPDGRGLYTEPSVVLGHMLLKVTPEAEFEKSHYKENGLVIVANARLDERETLMNRLQVAVSEREQMTDPLLLLRSYKKWGKDFVKDIYGDFTFAIWDIEKKELFCARDQIGVKPFVYYFSDNRFVFSTELRSVVKLPFVQTEIDNIYLRNRAIAICDQPQKTCWKNILRLKPAHTLELKNGQLNSGEYWKPIYKRNKRFRTEEDSAEAVKLVLEKIITDHTRVTANIGAQLSGGLDSSTVTCIAARILEAEEKKIVTASSIYTPGYTNPSDPDEIEYINEVIEQYPNIIPTFVHHSGHSFITGLADKLHKNFAPVNAFYYVDEALYNQFQSNSVRRVLSGYLGDLTVTNSAINPFPILLLSGRFHALYKLIKQYNKNDNQPIGAFLKFILLTEFTPKRFQKFWHRYKNKMVDLRDIEQLPLTAGHAELQKLQQKVNDTFNFPNLVGKNITHHVWPENIYLFDEEEDCACSHHQLEVTYPLCDRRLIELVLQIPVEHFYASGKKRGLIRKSMAGILPEKVRNRRSKGSYSPEYPKLIKKEMDQILEGIPDETQMGNLDDLIDVRKLKIDLKNLSKSEIGDSFTYINWTLLEIVIWLFCSKSLEIKNYKS